MKCQIGTKVQCLAEQHIMTITELGYFGVGQHLAYDIDGCAWVVDEDMIDANNPDLNAFTIIKEDKC